MLTAAKLGLTGPVGARAVTSLDLSAWHRRILRSAQRSRREIAVTLVVGLLLDAVVIGGCVGGGAILRRPIHQPYIEGGMAIGGGICLLMLLSAAITKPAGRAELASRLASEGFRQVGRSQNPAAGLGGMLILMIALYGSFALVESSARAIARLRFATVDREELARILAAVCATPTGVSTTMLRKHGQTVDDLRRPVAALLLDGWVVLRDGGRVVQQRSQGGRSIRSRHPLAEVFASGSFDTPV